MFFAKRSTIESPLSGLLTGVFPFRLPPTAPGLGRIELLSPCCVGNKIVIAIQEATVYMKLDAAGVPHWVHLLEVSAT